MTQEEYQHATRIARWACKGYFLTADEWEEVKQEAALAAWKYGLTPCTRVYWESKEAAIKIIDRKSKPSEQFIDYGSSNYEDDLIAKMDTQRLLDFLPCKQRQAVEVVVLQDQSMAEAGRKLNVNETTILRRKVSGLEQIKMALDL